MAETSLFVKTACHCCGEATWTVRCADFPSPDGLVTCGDCEAIDNAYDSTPDCCWCGDQNVHRVLDGDQYCRGCYSKAVTLPPSER